MSDILEMKQWILANAQQSRHPEYGDLIIAALEELEKARAEVERLSGTIENKEIALVAYRGENQMMRELDNERADFLSRTIGNRSLEHFVVRWMELSAMCDRLKAALEMAEKVIKKLEPRTIILPDEMDILKKLSDYREASAGLGLQSHE